MFKLVLILKAIVFALNINLAFCPCADTTAPEVEDTAITADVADDTATATEELEDGEEILCHSEDVYYPENDVDNDSISYSEKFDDPTEDTESEEDTVEIID